LALYVLAAFSEAVRAAIFTRFAIDPCSWVDLGGFERFVFEDVKRNRVVRHHR